MSRRALRLSLSHLVLGFAVTAALVSASPDIAVGGLTAGSDSASDVAQGPFGRFVAVGSSDTSGSTSDYAIARFNGDGSPDGTFSGDGRRRVSFGGVDRARAVAVQADGKIIVTGVAEVAPNDRDVGVVRLNPRGSLDTTFSGDGKRTFSFGSDFDDSRDIVVVGGKPVLVAEEETSSQCAVLRLNPNGSPDSTFSGNGRSLFSFPGGDCAPLALATSGTTIVVAVRASEGGGPSMAVARLRAGGSLDPDFSQDGRRVVSFPGSLNEFANAVSVGPNGSIVLAGEAVGDFGIARLNPNGSFDNTFSSDGRRLISFGNGNLEDRAEGVALRGDGKIVAAGYSDQGTQEDGDTQFAVSVVNPGGSLDTTFSTDGKRVLGFGAEPGEFERANEVVLRGGGILLAGGSQGPGPLSDFAFAALRANGSLDSSFSSDGKLLIGF